MGAYSTKYGESHALIIGINKYASASPLNYAVSDAEAVADLLTARFNFKADRVHLLIDEAATKEAILEKFLSFALEGTRADDRLLFYFAGHGMTVPSNSGPVGYLIPYGGRTKNLSTLIRWDELTRNAALIEAKHLLFIMDACYGGLAITRALKPGSMRFVKDMLGRFARQVITAGKADEVVSDEGGPLPNHSVFTGHLLQGLSGSAQSDRLITANGLMAYVYAMVGQDACSNQTPHYGYLLGDGDFVFEMPHDLDVSTETNKDLDFLATIPAIDVNAPAPPTIVDSAKDYLADEKHTIRLHDLVAEETRRVLALTAHDNFPLAGPVNGETFQERIDKYNLSINELASVEAVLCYWGNKLHQSIIGLAPSRLASRITTESGTVAWLEMRWYPVLMLMYAGGVAAIASGKYENLKSLLLTQAPTNEDHAVEHALTRATDIGIRRINHTFKELRGHEKQFVPKSEYLFKLLQPMMDDLFFIGNEYETIFDRFEVLNAITHCDITSSGYGPYGRYAWKLGYYGDRSPLKKIMAEAKNHGDAWAPLSAGMFGGSYKRFEDAASLLLSQVAQLHWN